MRLPRVLGFCKHSNGSFLRLACLVNTVAQGPRDADRQKGTMKVSGSSVKRTITSEPYRLTPKIYGVMAVTTTLTFATLVTGYQMLFSHQLFA